MLTTAAEQLGRKHLLRINVYQHLPQSSNMGKSEMVELDIASTHQSSSEQRRLCYW
ncbi:hypothetical protein GJ744_006684 [Endocarpon pusillum]|uniref:Uncharacterized protein n=1 Tax=Endocarpon pusillum TaxID=364733 RepID=A0A8H7AJT5_9EURO|nr:hypothetical protein GJ744_006684 [Endocarpon pusillum]